MRNVMGWALAALILTFLYLPSLDGDFVYDDQWMIVTNPSIRQIQPLNFLLDPGTVAAPASGLSNDVYRPLTTLAFAIDYRFWGLKPFMYRVENLLLHLFNGLLLWLFLRRLFKSDGVAWVGAGCFLFHPLQVQTVAWVTQRSGLLSATFMLGSLHVLLEKQNLGSIFFGGFLFLLGLLTKEVAIVLPGFLWLSWQLLKNPDSAKKQYPILGILAAIAVAFLLLRFSRLEHWSQMAGGGPSRTLGLLAFPVYIAKMFVPIALRVSYDFPAVTLARVLGGALFLVGWIVAILELRQRERALAVGMAWILVALLPVLQLIPVRAFMAERFAYVPLMGFALATGSLAGRSRFFLSPYSLWMVVLVFVTARAIPAWSSEYALWSQAVKSEPTNAFAHACLGQASRDLNEAEAQYRLALKHNPSRDTVFAALNNLSWIALRKNSAQESAVWAEQALAISPSDPQALYNAARADFALGKVREAEARIVLLEARMGKEHPMIRELKTYRRRRP